MWIRTGGNLGYSFGVDLRTHFEKCDLVPTQSGFGSDRMWYRSSRRWLKKPWLLEQGGWASWRTSKTSDAQGVLVIVGWIWSDLVRISDYLKHPS